MNAKARRRTAKKKTPPARYVPDVRALAAGALAVAALVAVGASILFSAPTLLLAPLAGLTAALACRLPTEAALVAFAATVAGIATAAAVSRAPWEAPSQWLPEGVGVALVAAIVAYAAAWARPRVPWGGRALQALGLALFLAALWIAGTAAANTPATDGSTAVSVIASPPALSPTSSDEDIYLHYIQRVRRGDGYYRSAAETLLQANSFHRQGIDVGNPLSFRLPTLYVALAALPPRAPVYAALAWASLAALAGFALVRRFAGPAPALVAAVATGTYCTSIATSVTLVNSEWWAGVLGLAALALSVWSPRARRPLVLATAAAAAALAAALVREIALPFVLVGLAAALLDPEARRLRAWLPWIAALALAVVVYALHWTAALDVIRSLHVAASRGGNAWFHPDGRGLVAAADRVGVLLAMRTALAWVVLALAVAGGVLAAVRFPRARIPLGAVAVAGPLLLAVVYPSGTSLTGNATSYWADVVMPTTVACLPLLLVALAPEKHDGRP